MHSQTLLCNNLTEFQKEIVPSNLLGSLENINYFVDVTWRDTTRTTLPCPGIPRCVIGVCAWNTYLRDRGQEKQGFEY